VIIHVGQKIENLLGRFIYGSCAMKGSHVFGD
jgi:hypothetical protein